MESNLEARLLKELNCFNLKFGELDVNHFDKADKSDPFNLRSVLACTTKHAEKSLGWSVATTRINKDHTQILDSLVRGLADKIRALPDQSADQDNTSEVKKKGNR